MQKERSAHSKMPTEKRISKTRLLSEVVVKQSLVGTEVVPGDCTSMLDGARDRRLHLLLHVLLHQPIYLRKSPVPQLIVLSLHWIIITIKSHFFLQIMREEEKEKILVKTSGVNEMKCNELYI